jgi:hypothetical protein
MQHPNHELCHRFKPVTGVNPNSIGELQLFVPKRTPHRRTTKPCHIGKGGEPIANVNVPSIRGPYRVVT